MNALYAIKNIVNDEKLEVRESDKFSNKMNLQGESFESYIKSAFSDTIGFQDGIGKNLRHNKVFSYLGNQTNPPDMMLKGGDAIEVKKLASSGAYLQMNSSYPERILKRDSTMITESCRNCEEWTQKDLIYCIGVLNKSAIKSIWVIDAHLLASDERTYLRVRDSIKKSVSALDGLEMHDTKELAKVKKVDPLGITQLRVRGMWIMDNPKRIYSYLYKRDDKTKFDMIGLFRKTKFNEYGGTSVFDGMNTISIADVPILDPDNPANMIDSVMVKYTI